jgi:hypothetical protein
VLGQAAQHHTSIAAAAAANAHDTLVNKLPAGHSHRRCRAYLPEPPIGFLLHRLQEELADDVGGAVLLSRVLLCRAQRARRQAWQAGS